jgi:drug/metabolite transporter (DMT)-like permease
MSDHTDAPERGARPHRAGAFDIRTFIGGLLGLYGVILVLTGLLGTDEEALAKSDGVNANLWTGVGLLVAGAVFVAWAQLRPVVVPSHPEDETAQA